MRPRVVIHNTVSLDGSATSVDVDMELRYGIANSLGAGGRLVGSATFLAGIEMAGELPEETDAGRHQPEWRRRFSGRGAARHVPWHYHIDGIIWKVRHSPELKPLTAPG